MKLFRSCRGAVAGALGLAALLALGGCKGPGFIAANLFPPKPIPALYDLPNKPTLIFVDDPSDRLPSQILLGLISDKVGQDLVQAKKISRYIEPRLLDDLRLGEADFPSWPIERAGRALGAQQVIYLQVNSFSLGLDDPTSRPTASVEVKVVDVDAKQRVFPPVGAANHIVAARLLNPVAPDLEGPERGLEARKLAIRMGREAAKLFFPHSPPEPGSGMRD